MFRRIDQLLIEHDYNDADLARIAGVGKSTVSGWRKGGYNPRKDKLQKIADHFGVSVEWITGEDDYRTKGLQETMDMLFQSRAQDPLKNQELFEIGAGVGRINGEYPIVENHDFNYGSGEYVDAITKGDSMYPLIMDGDIVTIHLTDSPTMQKNTVYVIKVDGESTTMKYVEFTNKGMWLIAENKEAYEDKFYSVLDVMNLPVKIIGTVVAIKRKL